MIVFVEGDVRGICCGKVAVVGIHRANTEACWPPWRGVCCWRLFHLYEVGVITSAELFY